MSRILKRPMFRRGGSTNTGIMSGLVDRKNYKFGSMTEDQIRSNIDMLVGLQDQFPSHDHDFLYPIPKASITGAPDARARPTSPKGNLVLGRGAN
jgi:hypothetical protein